jgi:DNA-directed RNA polymerase subunit H (RpoH/RPB5)
MQDDDIVLPPRDDHSDTPQGRFWMCLRTMTEIMFDRYGVKVPLEPYESVARKLRFMDLADTERSQYLMNQFEMCVNLDQDGTTIRVFWLCGKVGVKTESMIKIQNLFPTASAEEVADYEDIDDDQVAEFAEAQKGRAIIAGKPPDTVILVQVENCTITPPARKVAAKIPAIVEIFDCNYLRTNIIRHRLQPKFIILSQTEAEDVKRKYCATDNQLPKMLWEDPVRRYFGLRVGQVTRCVRLADGGKEVNYRIVITPSVSKKK